jgi:Carboxypeptidase regulatory-like domain
MIASWLLAVFAVTVPHTPAASRVTVRALANGRAELVTGNATSFAAGEELWSWSEVCPPQKLDSTDAPPCGKGRAVSIRLTLPKSHKGHAVVRWGTPEMLRAIPDALLPQAESDDSGIVRFVAPTEARVFARIADDNVATGWTDVSAPRPSLVAVLGCRVGVRVVDEHRQSIPRAQFRLTAAGAAPNQSPPFRAAAGAGALTVPAIPSRPIYRIIIWSDEFQPKTIVTSAARIPSEIVLRAGSEVSGRITEGHSPLSKAVLTATYLVDGTLMSSSVIAAADGRFRIGGLPAGRVELSAEKEGFQPQSQVLALGDRDSQSIAIALVRGWELPVRVTARDGRPIAAADVRVVGLPQLTRTDSAGLARLRGAPASGEIEAAATDYLTARQSIPTRAEDHGQPIEIVLRPAAAVRFRLLRKENRAPVTSGNVRVEMNGRTHLEELSASGETRIANLESGVVTVEVRPAGALPVRLPPRTIESGEQVDLGDIVVDDGLAAAGRIVDDESDAPLAGAGIRLLRPNDFGPSLSFVLEDWLSAQANDDGRFRFTGLSPGRWTAVIEAAGHARRISEVHVVPDEDVDLGTIRLASAKTLIVHCSPVQRCGTEARLANAGDAAWAAMSAPLDDGSATITPVGAGTQRLQLISERGAIIYERDVIVSADRQSTTENVRVPSLTIDGTVRVHGHPPNDGSVTFVPATDHLITIAQRTPAGTAFSHNLGTYGVHLTSAVVAGRFTIDGAVPGSYTVTYENGNGSSVPRAFVLPGDVERYPLDLSIESGTIAGLVSNAEGRPVAGAIVRALRSGHTLASCLTNDDGRFGLNGIGSGPVTVMATAGNDAAGKDVIVEDVPVDVTLTLKRSDKRSMTVLVTTADQQPLPGATVFLLGTVAFQTSLTGLDGMAAFRIDDGNASDALRVLSYAPRAGWAFEGPLSTSNATPTMSLTADGSETGALTIRSSHERGALSLATASGVSLDVPLTILGMRPAVSPETPFVLKGLPAGTYIVRSFSGIQRVASVRRNQETMIDFP